MSDKIVAFYSSKDQAERVRDDLREAGFDRDDVRIFTPDGPGFWRDLKETFGFADEQDRYLYEEAARRGSVAVLVDMDDADAPDSQTAVAIMQRHNPLDLDVQAQQWRKEGWQGYTAQADTDQGMTTANVQAMAGQHQQHQRPAAASEQVNQGEQVLPVVEEDVKIGKRAVQRGGLRVYSRVSERPVEEEVELREERATIERRPVDRPLGDADRAFQDRTIEVTERSEEPVVSKEARVVEEVVVGKEVEQHTQTVRETARRTDVEVEKLNPDNAQFTESFVSELSRDQRIRGRDWNEVEPHARRAFEQRYPGNKWEQFEDSIRSGYDRMRSKV